MTNPAIAAQAEELRPCPFCGAAAKIGRNFGRISAECTICGVSVRSGFVSDDDARKEVAEIWNTRAAPPEGMVMVPADAMDAAKQVCKVYFEIASSVIGEEAVRKIRDEKLAALAAAEAPQEGG